MNTLDLEVLREASIELNIRPAFIEKDWYGVQVLKLLSTWSANNSIRPVFTGGTALSKAHRVITRFSEDIDIRLESLQPLNRKARAGVRDDLIARLQEDGWILEEVRSRNENQFVGISIGYPISDPQPRLRPFIKLELNYKNPRRPILERPVSSFITELERSEPEVLGIACLALEEIASEKLSALCWRLEDEDQPDRVDLVRHLHDLACLYPELVLDSGFSELVLETIREDLDERTTLTSKLANSKLHGLPGLLAPYSRAYEDYVTQASYGEPPSFDAAMSQLTQLIQAPLL
jgi:predicted nucleotidyltransferase component of viral defense system